MSLCCLLFAEKESVLDELEMVREDESVEEERALTLKGLRMLAHCRWVNEDDEDQRQKHNDC